MNLEDRVFVVVDRQYGKRTLNLASRGPVLLIDTPMNCEAAERVWAEPPDGSHFEVVHVFESEAIAPAEEALIDGLNAMNCYCCLSDSDIAAHPFTVLEVVGASATKRVKATLGQYKFNEFCPTAAGFRAIRPALYPGPAFDWYSFDGLPIDREERDLLRASAEISLIRKLEDQLPTRLWKAWLDSDIAMNERDHQKIQSEIREFLINQAQYAGVRLLISDGVISQLIKWTSTEEGLKPLERFLDALMRNAKAQFGKDRIKITDKHWRTFKKTVVPELLKLQRQIGANSNRKRSVSLDELAAMIRTNCGEYSQLLQNLKSLTTFCKSEPQTYSTFAAGITKPAAFFDLWGAWATNHTPETFRHKVSSSKT